MPTNSDTSVQRDMTAVFDHIEINQEHQITDADHKYCQQQQKQLYATLEQLIYWYKQFHCLAEKYAESHRPEYKLDGSVETHERYVSEPDDYIEYDFLPFKPINKIVKDYNTACRVFANRIIGYFNAKYCLAVPKPSKYDQDAENVSWGFHPKYTDHITTIVNYLGGCSFREKAEEEIISSCLTAIRKSSYHNPPKLKGKTITLYGIFSFNEYHRNQIDWNETELINKICSAVTLFSDDRLDGSIGIIQRLDTKNVDTTCWYNLSSITSIQIRFYRNGRFDVQFNSIAAAEQAFTRLRLYSLTE